MQMIGKGYEIHPPANIIQEGDDGLPEERRDDAWIKISMSFLRTMKLLRGAKLAVWMAIALRINERYESFPSIKKMQEDTGLSNREIINTVKELEGMGYLRVRRGGKHNTYYVKMFAGFGSSDPILPGGEESSPVNSVTSPVNSANGSPVKSSLKQEEREINKKPDLVDGMIELSQSPGIKREARIDAILSYLGGRLNINSETKRWKDFAKFVDDKQQTVGEKVNVFIDWLLAQKDFDIQYWSPNRMREMWPQAFVKPLPTRPEHKPVVQEEGVYVPIPDELRRRHAQRPR
jgi:hypothetical protein